MEPTPPFEEAISSFKELLAREGWAQIIAWRRPEDVVRRVGKDVVVRHRSPSDAEAWARCNYDQALEQRLSVCLVAECEVDRVVCATMFWTADPEQAEYEMMPPYDLKMSLTVPRTRGKSVGLVGWWIAKKRLALTTGRVED